MRIVLLLLTLLALPVARAWATHQESERLVVNGQVLHMRSTPLAPLLRQRKDLRETFSGESTACHRGYIGTWHVEGDRLYLVSLVRGMWDPDLEQEGTSRRGGIVSEVVPLSAIFGEAEGPIEATWFTGLLRVPKRAERRYVHMGFATLYERELHLEIARGRVVGRRLVNMLVEGRGRSGDDMTWVGLASDEYSGLPVPDDGAWLDARAMVTPALREAVPEGKPFVTRGVLLRSDDRTSASLWIPATPVTRRVTIPLRNVPAGRIDRVRPHVELAATWRRGDGPGLVLHVRWLRLLDYGETIHHSGHPLPDLPPDYNPDPRTSSSISIRTPWQLRPEWLAGRLVVVGGTLTKGPVAQVLGVDVHAEPELVGQEVLVEGVLETWVITERLLKLDIPEIAPFRTRGPGTYYRLVHPVTEQLAKPKLPE